MSAAAPLHPIILWAQRHNCVFLTVNLSDVKDEDLLITPGSFEFKGTVDGETPKHYAIKFDFYAEVDPEKKTRCTGDRVIGLCIEKKDPANWPRLVKDTKKQPWLKTDFNKWKDLDGSDSDDDNALGGFGGGNGNIEQMLSMMDNKGLDDLDDEDDGNEADADSDDDDLPDLEEPEKVAKAEPKEDEKETKA
nr:hsp90 co chaperone (tebp) [Hymenolepis microstoma]